MKTLLMLLTLFSTSTFAADNGISNPETFEVKSLSFGVLDLRERICRTNYKPCYETIERGLFYKAVEDNNCEETGVRLVSGLTGNSLCVAFSEYMTEVRGDDVYEKMIERKYISVCGRYNESYQDSLNIWNYSAVVPTELKSESRRKCPFIEY